MQAKVQGPLALFLVGDFNSTSGSAVYRFLSTGSLDCAAEDRRNLSGQLFHERDFAAIGFGQARPAHGWAAVLPLSRTPHADDHCITPMADTARARASPGHPLVSCHLRMLLLTAINHAAPACTCTRSCQRWLSIQHSSISLAWRDTAGSCAGLDA